MHRVPSGQMKGSHRILFRNIILVLLLAMTFFCALTLYNGMTVRPGSSPCACDLPHTTNLSAPALLPASGLNLEPDPHSLPKPQLESRPHTPSISDTFIVFELYYSQEAHPALLNEPPFQPYCVSPNATRPDSHDIDGSKLLPLLADPSWQSLTCEYGAVFGVANHMREVVGTASWIGFQSWRAAQKHSNLSPLALTIVVADMRAREASGYTNVLYFWSDFPTSGLYESCDWYHTHCSKTYSLAFRSLFQNNTAPFQVVPDHRVADTITEFLPPVHFHEGDRQSMFSYWALHETQFKQYVNFARMFLVAIEGTFNVRDDLNNCPLLFERVPEYSPKLCWCFMMERLINIWAKYTGVRSLYLQSQSGEITEMGALDEYAGEHRWLELFGSKNMERLQIEFQTRLTPKGLELYEALM